MSHDQYQFEIRGRLAEHFGRWSWKRPTALFDVIETIVTCWIDLKLDETGRRYGEIFLVPNNYTQGDYFKSVFRFSCEDTRVPENVIVNEVARSFVREIEKKLKGEL